MKANEGNSNLQEGKRSQPAGIWKKSERVGQWADTELSTMKSPSLKQIASILLKECEIFVAFTNFLYSGQSGVTFRNLRESQEDPPLAALLPEFER